MNNPNSINSYPSTLIKVDYANGYETYKQLFVSYQSNAFVECSLSGTVLVPYGDWPVSNTIVCLWSPAEIMFVCVYLLFITASLWPTAIVLPL